jgi:hypothetical protein
MTATQKSKLLCAAGAAWGGTQWRTALARALEVPGGETTVRHWATGRRDIPADVFPRIASLLTTNAASLRDLASKLDGVTP